MVTPIHMTTGVSKGWIGHCIGSLNHHTVEVEQMMACLLAEVRTNREKLAVSEAKPDASLREVREEMRACQELLKEEMLGKLDAYHERMIARMDSWLEQMEVCLGKMEATDFEANPEEKESEADHEEVPEEEAAVETFGALKGQYGDWRLALRCCGHPKKRT
jgi:hypothetical protein